MSKHRYIACWVHLVWCTSNRYPFFDDPKAKAVSRYLTDYSKHKDIRMRINFVNPEHVHALVELGPSTAIEHVVKLLKGSSSHWINAKGLTRERFAWARGYAALAVHRDGVKNVIRYIATQKEHHSRISAESELNVLAPGWLDSLNETVETVSRPWSPPMPRDESRG